MSEIGTYHNKQSILGRMLELAAAIQGANKSDLLDPVVILFIESLAEEIYHLSTEIDNLEARALNKLSSILVSESGTIANPAHSLLHVLPREYKLELTATDSFILDEQKKAQDKLSLYPVCNTFVYNGGIRYFIFDRYLFSMDKGLNKTLITRSGMPGKEQQGRAKSFWIGLELDNAITNIENLSFYVNISEGYNNTDALNRLLQSRWECNGEKIMVRKGLFSREDELKNPKLNLFHKYSNSYKIDRKIKKHYEKYYVKISQPLDISGKREKFPAALKSCFPEEIRCGLTQELLWFEITCPDDFTEEMVRAIEISINIIPVSCKQLVKEVLQVNKHIPVIPLNTRANESFLSVHSLSNSDGVQYYDIPLSDFEDEKYGIYSLRSGGYERFGMNDANEFLANITNRLNQESAAFFQRNGESKAEQTILQNDTNSLIRELNKIIHAGQKHTEVKNYLLVEQQRETEIYFLEYWTANTLSGETIGKDIPVRCSSGSSVVPSGLFLVKPLVEGNRTPSQYEKYSLYKKSLAEHPLLVSPDDIRAFCMKEFGEIIERVEVGSGYKKSAESDFIKTTDVYLYIRKYQQSKIDKNINQHIEEMLEEHSPATFNYKVILK